MERDPHRTGLARLQHKAKNCQFLLAQTLPLAAAEIFHDTGRSRVCLAGPQLVKGSISLADDGSELTAGAGLQDGPWRNRAGGRTRGEGGGGWEGASLWTCLQPGAEGEAGPGEPIHRPTRDTRLCPRTSQAAWFAVRRSDPESRPGLSTQLPARSGSCSPDPWLRGKQMVLDPGHQGRSKQSKWKVLVHACVPIVPSQGH